MAITLLRTAFLLAVLLCLPGFAMASFHTFLIHQVFSNTDGSVQYVVLKEASGANGQNFLGGHALQSTSAGVTKSFSFPGNLPSSATANKFVLVGTQEFANLNVVTPDYIMPANFVPVSGGSIAFAGIDSVTFDAMPINPNGEAFAIDRNGTPMANAPTNFAGKTGSVPFTPPAVVPFSATLTATGPLTQLTLSGTVGVDTADIGRGGNVFVAALFAGTIYLLSPNAAALADVSNPLAYTSGPLTSINLPLAANANLSLLVGAEFYFGYGRGTTAAESLADMLSRGTLKRVYTVAHPKLNRIRH